MINMEIEPKSDQMNADDLISGPRTITITEVKGGGGNEQPISIFFEDDNGRPYKPCKTMRKIMVAIWGRDGKTYVGKAMTLFLDPTVKWGGAEVGGIRISEMSDMEGERKIPVTVTRGRKAPWTVKPLAGGPRTQTTADDALSAARQAANGGSDAFAMWWNTDYGKSCRAHVKPIMDELKSLAAAADQVDQEEDQAGDIGSMPD
ncbi:MAG: hypothetical protein KAT58_04105, partial [candidate division Zixibacteria bacterium]|nr:hypothetical protein [candidate division Zixibacteria bacterium]